MSLGRSRIGHVAIHVTDMDRSIESGEEGGFPGGSSSHAFYFCDPDGRRIEFYCWMTRISKPSIAAPTPDL